MLKDVHASVFSWVGAPGSRRLEGNFTFSLHDVEENGRLKVLFQAGLKPTALTPLVFGEVVQHLQLLIRAPNRSNDSQVIEPKSETGEGRAGSRRL